MAPLQSAKLYSEFRVNKDKEKHPEVSLPYVCVCVVGVWGGGVCLCWCGYMRMFVCDSVGVCV